MHTSPRLYSRLRNCLQTILDLEQSLAQLQLSQPLLAEFMMLKGIYERLDTLAIEEEDVCRIENATANFLSELKGPLSGSLPGMEPTRILQ